MMFLDVSKKPGDPDAVKTADEIVAENIHLRDLVQRLAQRLQMARLEGFGGPEREKLLDEAREAMADAVGHAVKSIDPHALPPFHEEYAIKTTQGYVWTGETIEERRLFKTREGAEELKARMEAEDAKYMACHQPTRTIVRRVVGEWEDA